MIFKNEIVTDQVQHTEKLWENILFYSKKPQIPVSITGLFCYFISIC